MSLFPVVLGRKRAKRTKRAGAKPGASRREALGVRVASPASPARSSPGNMVEQKKGAKQASISAFFSPTKAGEQDVEAEIKSFAAKRPRAASPAAKMEAKATNTTEEEAKKEESDKPKRKYKPRAKTASKAKARGKAKASPKPKPKKKKNPTRFISPHAVVDDEEDEDDLDDDDDVFNTPEARRARAELEAGGETVPAGAPISDDAIVNEEDIVDVCEGDDAAAKDKEEEKEEEKEKKGGDAEAAVEKGAATEEAVVDLTAASTSADEGTAKSAAENEKSRKEQAKVVKTVKSPASRGRPAKTPTKRQQKVKEKAAAEAKATPVEPLDPKTQARVDTYKLKTEELTKQFTKLLSSKQDSDAVMQDILGAALDCDLDLTVDQDKARQALAESWQKLRDHANSSSNASDAFVFEFPHEVKSLIVKGIQGRTSSLSEVSGELLASFKKEIEADDVDMEKDSSSENTGSADAGVVDRAASLAMEMEIKKLAERVSYGVRRSKANIFEDTSADALWVWEVGNPEKFFVDDAQKTIKRMRKNRKRLGQQLKTLAKVVQLLHQKPVDEAKVSAEEAKVGKFGFAVDAEVQKVKDREMKELEKIQAAEEKKRHELERKQAKDEEKKKREREEEEKKAVSSKRQKQFASYFVKPSSGSDAAAANGAGTSASAIDVTSDQDAESTSGSYESRSAKINRMDAAFSFLGSEGDSASGAANGSQQSIFSSFKDRRSTAKNDADKSSPKGWSAQRFRDPTLGAMKLLQFYENVRPAYYGTYSTRSRIFRGGRRPLAQYAKFDYSVDSDDEWEEEEPGESLSDADDDADESDEDNLDYEDQWLAYEDEVDYMDDAPPDDDEPMDRGERPSSPTKHKLPSQLQKKRVKAKAVKPAKLEPQIVGPFWCNPSNSAGCAEDHFAGLAGELLCEPQFESTLMRKAREYEVEQKRLEALQQEQQRKKEQQQEEEKKKAEEKKAQEDKEKSAAASTTDSAKPVAAAKTAQPTEKVKSPKAKSQKATPQKAKTPTKLPSAPTSTTPAKSTPVAVAATPSPAKSVKPIDSFFKKVEGPVPVPPQQTPQPQQPQQQDEQKEPKDDSVEVISVD